jgi:hypothetical protein
MYGILRIFAQVNVCELLSYLESRGILKYKWCILSAGPPPTT